MTEKEKNARIFKAFCDANRWKILGLLQSGEKCACKLLEELNIGQPTLSHHMKILCDAEIVVGLSLIHIYHSPYLRFLAVRFTDIFYHPAEFLPFLRFFGYPGTYGKVAAI